eukprot:6994964-Prymnesium_polylepis.1
MPGTLSAVGRLRGPNEPNSRARERRSKSRRAKKPLVSWTSARHLALAVGRRWCCSQTGRMPRGMGEAVAAVGGIVARAQQHGGLY